jgi:type I restriction enzyme S subunit
LIEGSAYHANGSPGFHLPKKWVLSRLGFLARSLQTGPFGSQLHARDYVEGGTPLINPSHLVEGKLAPSERVSVARESVQRLSRHLLHPGDIVFARRGEMGRCALVRPEDGECLCGTGSIRVRLDLDRIEPRYALHWLSSSLVRDWLTLSSVGSTMDNLNTSIIARIPVPHPPLLQQRNIADFLDRKTAAIDELVRKKQRLVELLQEKRQALIAQAITKGLNPGVPMKDAGIEWLGEIPTHWSVVKLRRLLERNPRNGISPPLASTSDGVPTFSISAVRSGKVHVVDNLKYAELPLTTARHYEVRPGDILAVRGNGNVNLVGRCGIVQPGFPVGCIYPDILMRLDLLPDVVPEFLVAALDTPSARSQIETLARTATGLFKISGSKLGNVRVAVPPKAEQDLIVRRIRTLAGQYEPLEQTLQKQLSLISEYRQSLITAAVTGQLDVSAG